MQKEIGKILEIQVDSKSLIRTRKTSPQKKLGHQERKKNLKHAFAVKHTFQAVKRVLLVDDIYTTGNTIDAVSNVIETERCRECLLFNHKYWTRVLRFVILKMMF